MEKYAFRTDARRKAIYIDRPDLILLFIYGEMEFDGLDDKISSNARLHGLCGRCRCSIAVVPKS